MNESRAAVRAAFVEVPVKWCTVHNWEATDQPHKECDHAYQLPPRPCRLVPCFINTTESQSSQQQDNDDHNQEHDQEVHAHHLPQRGDD